MNGSKVVWSAMEPWTITNAGPVPSTHTAIGVPSAAAISHRSVLISHPRAGRRSSRGTRAGWRPIGRGGWRAGCARPR